MILGAIKTKIESLPAVVSPLAKWDFGDGILRPAIFTQLPPPEKCPNPVLTMEQDDLGDFSVRGRKGGIYGIRCTLWGDKSSTDRKLRNIMRALYLALDRTEDLTFDAGVLNCGVRASRPGTTTDEMGFPGYVVTVEVTILEAKE